MEKISWTDCMRSEEVLHTVKKERNIVQTIKSRKADQIGHILCMNCLLKHVTEGKIERRVEVWEDKEQCVGSHWITFRKREGTGN
jgi:hypothetical protein